MKVLLVVVDGMRPDAMVQIPKARELMKKATYTLNGRTVFVSATLPAHMSLFHSVDTERHGTILNSFVPQVRPINGLSEVLKANGKSSAHFYTWELLRDLSRPGCLPFPPWSDTIITDQSSSSVCIILSMLSNASAIDSIYSLLIHPYR